MSFPIVKEMLTAASESLKLLRNEISDIRCGKIDVENNKEYVSFVFRGKKYEIPVTIHDACVGINAEADKIIALRALLDAGIG